MFSLERRRWKVRAKKEGWRYFPFCRNNTNLRGKSYPSSEEQQPFFVVEIETKREVSSE
jgi:hypothetical protein